MKKIILIAGICLLSFSFAARADEAKQALLVAGEIPVQHSGRVKPFESFAQESVLFITGKRTFRNIPPVQNVLHWITNPEKYGSEPLISVSYKPLAKEFGAMVIDGRISPELVLNHRPFVEKVEAAARKKEMRKKISLWEQKRADVYEKALLFQQITDGTLPGWIPQPENTTLGWLPLTAILQESSLKNIALFYSEKHALDIEKSFVEFLKAAKNDFKGPNDLQTLQQFKSSLKELLQSRQVMFNETVLKAENTYNRFKPFYLAAILYFISALLIIFTSLFRTGSLARVSGKLALVSLILGFLIHAFGFFLRCWIAGRPPVTNMYESVIWVSWAVVLFSFILYAASKNFFILGTASTVAGLALLIAYSFPLALDPTISPLVPVLRSNMWLTVHVLTITMSYGAFLLAWGIGHAIVFSAAFSKKQSEPTLYLVQFLYRCLQIGVILLAAGTVLGGVWANYSWGRFWGWDPKETWALIALLGYLVVLHGRFAGWLNAFSFAAASVVAFLGILMAWYGVNFVLAAGLHSYGFGAGGSEYVFFFAILDLILVGVAGLKYRQNTATYKG